jgi:hypothetical protein
MRWQQFAISFLLACPRLAGMQNTSVQFDEEIEVCRREGAMFPAFLQPISAESWSGFGGSLRCDFPEKAFRLDKNDLAGVTSRSDGTFLSPVLSSCKRRSAASRARAAPSGVIQALFGDTPGERE